MSVAKFYMGSIDFLLRKLVLIWLYLVCLQATNGHERFWRVWQRLHGAGRYRRGCGDWPGQAMQRPAGAEGMARVARLQGLHSLHGLQGIARAAGAAGYGRGCRGWQGLARICWGYRDAGLQGMHGVQGPAIAAGAAEAAGVAKAGLNSLD